MESLNSFANAIRCLSIDMVNSAGSGHQGAPLGFADVMAVLFKKSMNFDPMNEDRDRLILSAGHASAMLYSAIYLSQKTKLTINDLKKFRKFEGICQGHPEINKELGIEMTTGALGQGIATSVGIAIALKKKKINSKVYVIVGDGDLMEGISHESMTLASSLNLDNLIIIFDNNNVCIDGFVNDYTTDNLERFRAYGFDIFEANGHDYCEIFESLEKAKKSKKPSFISFKTKIGFLSNHAENPKCHGKFLSSEEIEFIREKCGFSKEAFSIPQDILIKQSNFNILKEDKNDTIFEELSSEINKIKKEFIENPEINSTRQFAGKVFGKLSEKFEQIIGGSADLSESTCSISGKHKSINRNDFSGNFIHYGIREHAMGSSMNGLSIEGFVPYGGTFLVFSDYMRPAIRNAALMKIGTIFVFTHDSIAVGEDGATHQPIEHISSLRTIPNLNVFRPCCDVEVAECIEIAIKNRNIPSALILSRQNVKNLRKAHLENNCCEKGIYELIQFKENGLEKLNIIASGSEVSLSIDISYEIQDKFDVRIFSAPCLELFKSEGIDKITGRKLIIEAGIKNDWYKYASNKDIIIGINDFGQSGTKDELLKRFGFTVDEIVKYL